MSLLIILLNSAAIASPICGQVFSSLPGGSLSIGADLLVEPELGLSDPTNSVDRQSALSRVEFVLEESSEVNLGLAQMRDRHGDAATVLQRKLVDPHRNFLHIQNIKRLWGRLLERYYLSFSVRQSLLPGQALSPMSYGKDDLARLLPLAKVSNPQFPALRPSKVDHQDYHLVGLELDVFDKHSFQYDKLPSKQDLPDLEVTSLINYKFKGHGDSHKERKSYVGRRFEITTTYEAGHPSVEIYHKARLGSDGKIVARTLVFKDKLGTTRMRLPVESRQNIKALIVEVLNNKYLLKSETICERDTVVKLRSTVKIVLGGDISNAIDIGRLSVDVEANLEKPLTEKVLSGEDSLWGKYFYGISGIYDLGFTLEKARHPLANAKKAMM